jgi:hypothetical protein
MRSPHEAKELLARLYGLEFPEGFFLLHEFLVGLGAAEREGYFNALGMWPLGPLELLSLPEAELKNLQLDLPVVLHWRFYRDVPEFFTCFRGDRDWLHWGLLLDEPAKRFRGCASYYHQDTSPICVYPSLFSAVLKRLESRTEPAGSVEDAEHRRQQDRLRAFSEKMHAFIKEKRVSLDDGRGKGLPSDTGLDLLVAETGADWFSSILDWFSRWPRSDWSVFPPTGHPHAVHLGKLKELSEIQRLVREAIAASQKGRALPALSLGRSLWYYGEERWLVNSSEYSTVARDLLKRAYTLLDRPALVQILNTHFEHRAQAPVDLLEASRKRGIV